MTVVVITRYVYVGFRLSDSLPRSLESISASMAYRQTGLNDGVVRQTVVSQALPMSRSQVNRHISAACHTTSSVPVFWVFSVQYYKSISLYHCTRLLSILFLHSRIAILRQSVSHCRD